MISQPSYYDFVEASLKRRPGLQMVRDFMSTHPDCYCFDIQVTHILKSGQLHPHTFKCQSTDDLKRAIGPSAPADRVSTIILAEDITKNVIEALGSLLSLEPEFFALHLRGHSAYRTGKWSYPTAPALDLLPSYLRDAPFYSMQFRRPSEFSGGLKEIIEICQNPSRTHVPRPARISEALPVVFLDERVSVYTKRDLGGVDFGRSPMALITEFLGDAGYWIVFY